MLFRKKEYTAGKSLSAHAWRRFKRNRLAFSSLLFILLISIMAILGYLITPDPTPMANSQHLELARQKPGFSVDMLRVKRNRDVQGASFFHKMLYGETPAYTMLPVSGYEIRGHLLYARLFRPLETGEPVSISYSLPDILYPLNTGVEVSRQGDTLFFEDIYGNRHSETASSLGREVAENSIVKKRFLLGTDPYGRDLLSRLMIGARVSLSVGFISVFISLLIGISMGALAGFFRGRVDNLIVWVINVVWSIPTLLLVIAITFALGKGFWQVFIAVGLTMWVEVARVVRGQILSMREKEFVEAGRALGYNNFRIIFRHVLPNVMSPVIVIAAANFASAILIEAGLSFLGIGVQPPMPSWGSMIRENYAYIILDAAYLAIIPGIAIMLMVLAFMIIGSGLRDALDVKAS